MINNADTDTATTTTTTTTTTKLRDLRIWFEQNPNLPKQVEPILLRRFLKCMSYDVAATQKLIELNYSLRNKHANIFIDRQPDDEETVKGLKASDCIILPGITPERLKLLLFRMVDLDPGSRNSLEEAKIFFMLADARFTSPDVDITISSTGDDEKKDREADTNNDETESEMLDADIADGDVHIVDIHGYTMRHIARISFFVLRANMKFLHEAYPSRLRAMHIINCPVFLDKLIAFVKPFIQDEVFRMITFHTEGLDSLYEHVPRDMLPEEYGGKAGNIADIKAHWLQTIVEKKNYLNDERHWRVAPSQNRSRWSWF